jgi:hypothetical protein
VLERPLSKAPTGEPEIKFDLGFARFVFDRDGRGEGLCAIHVETTDRQRILDSARRANVGIVGDAVEICGTRFVLH